jgi:DNA-binding NtrC family response regulator
MDAHMRLASPSPLVLIVDDDAGVCWALRQALVQDGFTVAVAGNRTQAERLARRHRPALVITDLRLPNGNGLELVEALHQDLPEVPVVLTTAYGSLDIAVQATTRGAFGYLPKPLDLDHTLALARRVCGRAQPAISVTPDDWHAPLVGGSPPMQEVYRRIAAAAASDVPVLIQGPSGTGKELVARSIHRYSRRCAGPFVAVNCGAIPPELAESELFGHLAGAFTSAAGMRAGRCQAAAGGVLFLDEVGDLPVSTQVTLLRFLDQHRVVPVGSTQEIAVDVRVIAASNRPLHGEGALLREDLYFRLRGITITTPALDERRADLPELVTALMARLARRLHRPLHLSHDAMSAILARRWPGNVRELKHRLEEAAVFAPGGHIAPEHLATDVPSETRELKAALTLLAGAVIDRSAGEAHAHYLRACRAPLLRLVLDHTGGNLLRAGELLGINRATLKRWAQEDGVA